MKRSSRIMFDHEGSRGEFLQILAEMGEEPAFMKRARAPEIALQSLLQQCTTKRASLLLWPRRHFSALQQRTRDDWDRLSSLVTSTNARDDFAVLAEELATREQWRSPLFSTDRSLLRNFVESAVRFNHTWDPFLKNAGLEEVNRLRMDYNAFYPMERSCAFGTDAINRDFAELPLLSRTFLEMRFPLLAIPQLA